MKRLILLLCLIVVSKHVYPQNKTLDEVSTQTEKVKVLHAEPLYIDLIRDLGARKGEKEWNVAMGAASNKGYTEYEALVEYEWAVIDRLGLEIEIPATFYSGQDRDSSITIPSNQIESLKGALQWSFFVSEQAATTLALGYLHEFKLADLGSWTTDNVYKGNLFNPFFVAAKRWGTNWHSLIYTGPKFFKKFGGGGYTSYEINTSFHYMPFQSRHFVGIEINQSIHDRRLNTVLRPQLRLQLSESFLIGCVTAIPIAMPKNGIGSFVRIIYEPH